ncbi:collagen-like protein [Providencia rettgeri]|uniref:collagen-like protein n=1 Tax=Providencia rettgeri TaxID=587 RepID=UPI00244AD253|nr:collagen-like protein [Providencia rettgeri]MDH2369477.1 collagen-like protein [Providencia rettgeri]
MAKGRTVSLIFKNNAGLALSPVSFTVNDGEQGAKGDKGLTGDKGAKGDKGDKGDNATLDISSLTPAVKGGETSFPIGNVKVLSVTLNGLSQPQGYAYTIEGTTLFLAEALKTTDFISIEVTK